MKLRCLRHDGLWFAGVDGHKNGMPAWKTHGYGYGGNVDWCVRPDAHGCYLPVFAFIKSRLQ